MGFSNRRIKTTRVEFNEDRAQVFFLSKADAAALIRALAEDLAGTVNGQVIFRSGEDQYVFVVKDEDPVTGL